MNDHRSYIRSLNDQLPVGLIAQLVERCTGIAFFFSGLIFATALVAKITATIIHLFIISSAVQIYEFSYIHYQSQLLYRKIYFNFRNKIAPHLRHKPSWVHAILRGTTTWKTEEKV